MGRWSYSNKQEVDDFKKIGVSFLKKYGYFDNGWRTGTINWSRNEEKTGSISIRSFIYKDEQYLNFVYTQTDSNVGEKKDFDYKVSLATTPCNFGGKRYWFICPLTINGKYCGRRVGILYKAGDYFGCRYCYDLTYGSKNLNRQSKFYPLFSVLTLDKKIEDLRESMKRRIYAGKLTRKALKIEKLGNKAVEYSYMANLFK